MQIYKLTLNTARLFLKIFYSYVIEHLASFKVLSFRLVDTKICIKSNTCQVLLSNYFLSNCK